MDYAGANMTGGGKSSIPAGPTASDDVRALKERAKGLMKCRRYDEASKVFKELTQTLHLQRVTRLDSRCNTTVMQEIGALEGLAICLSRQLNHSGAEAAQRQALALRCREWEMASFDSPTTRKERSVVITDITEQSVSVLKLKRAALPSLRTLAVFVSSQGRYSDAENILCTVLRILAQHQAFAQGAPSGGPTLASPHSALGKPASKIVFNAVAESTGMSSSDNDMDRYQSLSAPRSENDDLETNRTERADSAKDEIKPERSTGQERFPSYRRGAPGLGFPVPEPPPLSLPPSLASVGLGNDAQSKAEVVALESSGGSLTETGFVVCPNRVKSLRAKKNILVTPGLRDEMLEIDRELEDAELEANDSEHMAAVTKHHLAVVLHAQGRVREALQLLEESVASLKQRHPPQAVPTAQALHDLASFVRPIEPARACFVYLEALDLLENTRVEKIIAAPTLAKLGSLLGASIVAAAAIPPVPAAPAGPGRTGRARSAGLAEAVCAAGESFRTKVYNAKGASKSAAESADSMKVAAGPLWDLKEAQGMIKRAIVIQGGNLGLRHPAVASSLQELAELYRKQGRLSEAEPLFRKAIGIREVSRGPLDVDAVVALHGMAHCVLARAGADWLGKFEEAFSLVDQAYRIASTLPESDLDGGYSSCRLLLEALRMIRTRQRQGRAALQPASAAIMEAVWNGRWDPEANNGAGSPRRLGESAGVEGSEDSAVQDNHARNSSRGDDTRCAVCLEEVEVESSSAYWPGGSLEGLGALDSQEIWMQGLRGGDDVKADIGTEGAFSAEREKTRFRGRFSQLPCGHRFHTQCIGRWLVHSSTCPSCRCLVQDGSLSSTAPPSENSSSGGALPPGGRADGHHEGPAEGRDVAIPRDNAPRARDGDEGGNRPRSPGGRWGDNHAPFC